MLEYLLLARGTGPEVLADHLVDMNGGEVLSALEQQHGVVARRFRVVTGVAEKLRNVLVRTKVCLNTAVLEVKESRTRKVPANADVVAPPVTPDIPEKVMRSPPLKTTELFAGRVNP